MKKITQLQKQNLTGEHNCVGGKSSVYSKGMMQSMLGKCWPELFWQSESLQLVTLCCVYLKTVQLQGVGKARYESRVELMLICIHKWRRYFFLTVGGMEYNHGGKNLSDSQQGSHTQFDRFCHISFVSIQCFQYKYCITCLQSFPCLVMLLLLLHDTCSNILKLKVGC